MSPINSKKNIVQDVMPPKRSIREVELSPRHKTKSVADIPTVSKPTKSADKDVFERPVSLKKNSGIKKTLPEYDYNEDPKNNHRFGLWIALSIFVLALAFGISSFWKGAIIKITPKNETAGFNEIFSAKKNTAGADLSFQTVTVTEDSSASVAATGQKQVDTNASGRIIIYNKGSISQKLIATTRFETPEGLIFRLNSAVTVPAQKGTLPGSVEGLVTADRPGESYNIGLKDFTLPGLKGTSKYTQIFARSKTSISGGFSGIKKIVSDEILNETDRSLESNLRQDMARNLLSQIPDNYILYPQSITFSFEPTGQVSTTTSDSSTAILRKKGTATGVIFDKGALTRATKSPRTIPTEVSSKYDIFIQSNSYTRKLDPGTKFLYELNKH
jgi:hypothetical protein